MSNGASEIRAGYLSLPILHPETHQTGTAFLECGKAKHVQMHFAGWRHFEMVYSVRETAVDPERIFKYEDDSEEWKGYCYTRQVNRRYHNDGSSFPAPRDKVFIVVLTHYFVVIEWGWEDCNPSEAATPILRKGRLGEQLWPTA
ncbi:MAG: hypothetical protein HY292_03210 [Planctomycetes bacterium]|nr:hypothetical protein [Planctomycetota bacterium]